MPLSEPVVTPSFFARSTSAVQFTTAPITVVWGSIELNNMPGLFEHNAGFVTPTRSGLFYVAVDLITSRTSGNTSEVEHWIELDGVEVLGSTAVTTHADSSRRRTSSSKALVQVFSGQVICARVVRSAGTGGLQVDMDSRIIVQKVG